MIKPIVFNLAGSKLWINIEMRGIYFITYTYQLWSSDPIDNTILTSPLRHGSNQVPNDDHYAVINDFKPNEPIPNYVNRIIDVRFWVKKGPDDNGYNLRVAVLQGNSFQSASIIGHEEVSGNVGSSLSIKEEFITLRLVINDAV